MAEEVPILLTADELAAIRARADRATRKPIPNCGGYEADIYGAVWSTATNWRGYGARLLQTDLDEDGYPTVRLYRDGRRVRQHVHVLVARAFHGNPLPNQQVRHLDGTCTNNTPSNLCWGTAKENAEDRARHGRTATGDRNAARLYPERLARGERHGTYTHPGSVRHGSACANARLDENIIVEARELRAAGLTCTDIARRFGVARTTISMALRGGTWSHVK